MGVNTAKSVNLLIKSNFKEHAFKVWVDGIINKHFTPSIAKRFYGVFEVEKYHKGSTNIARQLKDQKYIMEVYYTNPSGIHQYICDLFSEWPKEYIESQLLRYITDKFKNGEIGQDWQEKDGKVDQGVLVGTYETKTPVITQDNYRQFIKGVKDS